MKRIILSVLGVLSLVALSGCLTSNMIASKFENKYPPLGDFIEVDGYRQHVVDRGQGAPIVFLHGASANIREFTSTLSPHLDHQPVRQILIDRPGLGHSQRIPGSDTLDVQARTASRIISELTDERVILVGHSFGGAVSLRVALDYPDQVKAVVMLSPVTHDWGRGGMTWYNQVSGVPILGDAFTQLVPYLGPGAVRSGLDELFFPAPVPDDYIEDAGVDLIFRPRSFRDNAKDVLRLREELAAQQVRYQDELKKPVYVFSGVYDTVLKPPLHSLRLRREVGDIVSVIDLSDEGHMPHHGKAADISALILALAKDESVQVNDFQRPNG